ncbi:hypothetical protein ACLESD_21735 [Pyxidicoccus sp. 3LFB2]
MKLTNRNLWSALLGLSLAACGPMDEAELEPPAQQEQELPAGCTSVASTTMTTHACFHYNTSGDNITVAASATRTTSAAGINTKHRHYTVNLPSGAEGSVTFVPAATTAGDTTESVAFYLSPSATFTLLTSGGTTVAPGINQTFTSSCGLSKAVVYDLNVGSTYILAMGPVAGNQVRVVPEYLDDNRVRWYRDADGDTYGSSTNSVLTACEPASGYVNRRFDCNDNDPNLFNC